MLNAYAIVLAALMVSAGRLADRHGAGAPSCGALAIFVLGSALCGAAPSVEALVGARVIQAAGAALLLPTSLALLLPEFEPEERSQAIGSGPPSAASPPPPARRRRPAGRAQLAARLPRQFPIGLAAIAYGIRLLRESRDERQERPTCSARV